MVMIGIDPHKQTHSAAGADGVGLELSRWTEPAVREGFGVLLGWARELDGERVWVLEDCRHVSGPFERFLIDHGETVVRLAPNLIAGARQSVRERGKSDPIDALAVRSSSNATASRLVRPARKGCSRTSGSGFRTRVGRAGQIGGHRALGGPGARSRPRRTRPRVASKQPFGPRSCASLRAAQISGLRGGTPGVRP